MKKLLPIVIALLFSNCSNYKEQIKDNKEDYLGQTPPKDSAIIFASGLVSVDDRYEYGLAIAPSFDEIYFTAEGSADSTQLNGLIRIKKENNVWLPPELANLNKQDLWEQEAFFSPDGKELFYAVYKKDSMGIWKSEKTIDGWSKGVELSQTLNNSSRILFYATLSINGNLYYSDVIKRKILMVNSDNGNYNMIVDPNISKSGHAFIAPDESFMLIDALVDTANRTRDIFAVFKNSNGVWGEPINLGPKINTEYSETCPSLSPDGKYIFFGRYNDANNKSNIYWISSEILDEIKP